MCELCSQDCAANGSDANRKKIEELDKAIPQIGRFKPAKGISMVRELIELYAKEGIDEPCWISRSYSDLFQMLLAKGERGELKEIAELV